MQPTAVSCKSTRVIDKTMGKNDRSLFASLLLLSSSFPNLIVLINKYGANECTKKFIGQLVWLYYLWRQPECLRRQKPCQVLLMKIDKLLKNQESTLIIIFGGVDSIGRISWEQIILTRPRPCLCQPLQMRTAVTQSRTIRAINSLMFQRRWQIRMTGV